MAQLLDAMLCETGYDVIALTRPTAALARVKAGEQLDLAVLDMVMPGVAGVELAAQLRTIHPDLGTD